MKDYYASDVILYDLNDVDLDKERKTLPKALKISHPNTGHWIK